MYKNKIILDHYFYYLLYFLVLILFLESSSVLNTIGRRSHLSKEVLAYCITLAGWYRNQVFFSALRMVLILFLIRTNLAHTPTPVTPIQQDQ